MTRRCLAVVAPLAVALLAIALVHLFPPTLAITWSYAGLYRHRALPVAAAMLLAVLPTLAGVLWRRPAAMAPLGRMRGGAVIGAAVVLAAAFVVVVWLYGELPPISLDQWWLVETVRGVRATSGEGRWYLIVGALRPLARPFHGDHRAVAALIRYVNAVVAAGAVVALVAAVRRLARTRGEAIAMGLLVVTAMGVAQLLPGYPDVYPIALLVVALYLWTALRTLDGDGHPAWPMTVLALGPFIYLGLLLLAPSGLVVALTCARRRGGVRRLVIAAVVAIVVAGIATVPGFGRPFAWLAWERDVAASSERELGLSPTSSLLPFDYMLSRAHAPEVAHTLFLVDPVGWVLLATAGVAVAVARWRERWHPAVAFLLAILVPYLAYVVAMDPLWGAFADWDLFGFQVAATALLASWAFVVWGRECPRACGVVLGFALATAGVHLLARWQAMHVDHQAHLIESPFHVPGPKGSPYFMDPEAR